MQYIFENKGNWVSQFNETSDSPAFSFLELGLSYSLGGNEVNGKPVLLMGGLWP